MPPFDANHANLTFHFEGTALPLGANPALALQDNTPNWSTLLAAIDSDVQDLVDATCPSTVSIVELQLKVGPSASGPTFTRTINSPGAQNSATDSPATALLVRKVAPTVSARLAGRMFWPTPSSVDIDNGGIVGGASVAQFQTAFDDFYTALTAITDLQPGIFFGPNGFRSMTSFAVQSRVATQRRRNRR